MTNAFPRLSATPPRIDHAGPAKGRHNEEIYCGRLGYAPADLAFLTAAGVI